MPINTNLWRAQIGTFGIMIAKLCVMNTWSSITKATFQNSFVLSFFFLITFLLLLLILSDKKIALGAIFQQLVGTNTVLLLILSNQVIQKLTIHYGLICLPGIWLDSATSIDSNDLSLKGYNLHCVDDPGNIKKAGVCVYYKETLAIQFLQTKLGQSIVNKVIFKHEKKDHVISFYRSPRSIW